MLFRSLIEASILDGSGERNWAGGCWRHMEGIPNDLRATRLDGVVVSDNLGIPDLMFGVECATRIDQAVGKGVGALVEVAVRSEKTALKKDRARLVFYSEINP